MEDCKKYSYKEINMKLTAKALKLIKEKELRDSHVRAAKFREAAYRYDKTDPRLEHVYKDRSFKSALALELKPLKAKPSEHWCWDKSR